MTTGKSRKSECEGGQGEDRESESVASERWSVGEGMLTSEGLSSEDFRSTTRSRVRPRSIEDGSPSRIGVPCPSCATGHSVVDPQDPSEVYPLSEEGPSLPSSPKNRLSVVTRL